MSAFPDVSSLSGTTAFPLAIQVNLDAPWPGAGTENPTRASFLAPPTDSGLLLFDFEDVDPGALTTPGSVVIRATADGVTTDTTVTPLWVSGADVEGFYNYADLLTAFDFLAGAGHAISARVLMDRLKRKTTVSKPAVVRLNNGPSLNGVTFDSTAATLPPWVLGITYQFDNGQGAIYWTRGNASHTATFEVNVDGAGFVTLAASGVVTI